MRQIIAEEEKGIARDFCAKLRDWREDLNLSQSDVAQLIGHSPSWVSMVERGAILPDYSTRHRLRIVLEEKEFQRASRRRKRSSVFGVECDETRADSHE